MAGIARTPADAASALAFDANGLNALRAQARESPEKALAKAAGQFEALFVQMMLKQMRESLPKDGPLDSDSIRTYTAMFDQQLAQQLSKRGIGLKEAIERQLAKRIAPASDGVPSPATRAGTTPTAKPLPDHPPAATPANPVTKAAGHVQAFVSSMRPHAEKAAAALGVPAHYLIAQAGLETGWGKHQPRDANGAVSHNLFGVKATGRWNGASVAAATTEFVQGVAVRTVEKFRAYGSYAAAFQDAARVLSGKRYADALANAGDASAYARGLQRAGYATDPAYADKLSRAIRMVAAYAVPAELDGRRANVVSAGLKETAVRADIEVDRGRKSAAA